MIWYNRNKWKNKYKAEEGNIIGTSVKDYSLLSLYMFKSNKGTYFIKIGALGTRNRNRDFLFGEIKSRTNHHTYMMKYEQTNPNIVDDFDIKTNITNKNYITNIVLSQTGQYFD